MQKKRLREKLESLIEDSTKETPKINRESTISDLRARIERLQKIRHKGGANNTEGNAYPLGKSFGYDDREYDILTSPSVGKPMSNATDGFSLWEHSFTPDHMHGEILLGTIKRVENPEFVKLTNDARFNDFDYTKTLFIDTETTGLAGGTGTLAFLIGAGYYDGDTFRVMQYFMHDYGEEARALAHFANFATNYDYLVTFNGKGFDIPLLQARMILNRINFDFSLMPHFDLLYSSRDLFKYRLENCRLGTIEQELLRFYREDDVASSEIPYLYFKYIRTRNPALVDRVFYHNTMDIVSLAALAAKLGIITGSGIDLLDQGEDLFALGNFNLKRHNYQVAEQCFIKAINLSMPYELRLKLLIELSLIYKRSQRWKNAEEIWKGIKEGSRKFEIFPYEELAKYYEHVKKSLPSAMKIVTEAISSLEANQAHLEQIKYIHFQKSLLHRLKRLEKKLAGRPW